MTEWHFKGPIFDFSPPQKLAPPRLFGRVTPAFKLGKVTTRQRTNFKSVTGSSTDDTKSSHHHPHPPDSSKPPNVDLYG